MARGSAFIAEPPLEGKRFRAHRAGQQGAPFGQQNAGQGYAAPDGGYGTGTPGGYKDMKWNTYTQGGAYTQG